MRKMSPPSKNERAAGKCEAVGLWKCGAVEMAAGTETEMEPKMEWRGASNWLNKCGSCLRLPLAKAKRKRPIGQWQ